MPMQWYPGHMKAARQEIAKAIPSNDVVLEVLDARVPFASSNPMLAELRRGKPCLTLLTKVDLADSSMTKAWVRHLESGPNPSKVLELALTQSRPAETRARILEACRVLAPHRNTRSKAVRAIIVGTPNVGKSTLINVLTERKVARVSDQPGVTTTSQVVVLRDGMTFCDNAGVLWQRMDESSVMRLAIAGAIPDSEMDYTSAGLYLAEFLLARYAELVVERYGLDAATVSPTELLELIGRRHGGLGPGGKVELRKAGCLLVHEFRSGKLGRITLEEPEANGQ